MYGARRDVVLKKANRDIERHYFERFNKAYELPPGTVCYADKPDVLVKGGRTIGIEITNFYLQPGSAVGSEQRQGPRRKAIVSAAHEAYRNAGGKGIELTIQFNFAKPITSDRKRKLVKELADLAACVDTQPSGPLSARTFEGIPEIASVWLNSKEYADAQWRLAQVHSVEEMAVAGLEAIVREKESKAAEYAPCDAYWLLVVVEFIDPAQDQEITDGVKIASSIFEKVIVYKPAFEQILEVR